MSKGRLTRQELSWLLTQEAQNAAERLRSGVQVLRTQAPPPPEVPSEDPSQHVDASLDALDDVMKMLSNLNQRATSTAGVQPGRRGRIDLAAVIVEVAPDARVSIEPGSGTEIFGDEADLRRMLQVLVGHGSGEGAGVTVRRDGDEVRVAVVLGPDSSPTAETERAWLSRMALRYGGRHELEGGTEIVSFPAEGVSSEREALRKELDEARKQGEVYARELAAVFDRGEEIASVSTMPPAPGQPLVERFAAVTAVCAGIAAELRAVLNPLARDVGAARRHEITDEQIEMLRRRAAHVQEIVTSVASAGALSFDELATEVDLGEVLTGAMKECAGAADRGEVKLSVRPSGADRVYVRRGAKALLVIAREIVTHAVASSPRGGIVELSVQPDAGDGTGPKIVVDDAGPSLPASGRRAFLSLETQGGAYGRPTALPIFLAAEIATCVGATLELSDAPSGGLRVAVGFPTL